MFVFIDEPTLLCGVVEKTHLEVRKEEVFVLVNQEVSNAECVWGSELV